MTSLDEFQVQDRHGRVYGLTWPAPLHRWGIFELSALFWAARHVDWVSAALRRLAVVRGATWSIVTHVPDGDGGRRKLPRPVLFFDASFDVDLRRYIEIFAESIRWRFRAVWGSGIGYPGVLPTEGFLRWVDAHKTDASHYWCAYPEATTRMVDSAVRVSEQLDVFEASASSMDDEVFATELRRVLAVVANDL